MSIFRNSNFLARDVRQSGVSVGHLSYVSSFERIKLEPTSHTNILICLTFLATSYTIEYPFNMLQRVKTVINSNGQRSIAMYLMNVHQKKIHVKEKCVEKLVKQF